MSRSKNGTPFLGATEREENERCLINRKIGHSYCEIHVEANHRVLAEARCIKLQQGDEEGEERVGISIGPSRAPLGVRRPGGVGRRMTGGPDDAGMR